MTSPDPLSADTFHQQLRAIFGRELTPMARRCMKDFWENWEALRTATTNADIEVVASRSSLGGEVARQTAEDLKVRILVGPVDEEMMAQLCAHYIAGHVALGSRFRMPHGSGSVFWPAFPSCALTGEYVMIPEDEASRMAREAEVDEALANRPGCLICFAGGLLSAALTYLYAC